MKYKKLKQHIIELEELTHATIQVPTKAEWKALSQEEQNVALSSLVEQAFYCLSTAALEAIRAEVLPEETEEDYSESEVKLDDTTLDPISTDIDTILTERGSNYGSFSGHANLAQTLKSVFDNHVRRHGKPELFNNTKNEAIDMIFHKLARIGNGDPTYIDSWTDIIGYTQLVIDELEKGESR